MEPQQASGSMSRHIIIAAHADMPQANALAIELRRLGFPAAIATDVRTYLPYASAVVALLSPTTLYQQPVVSAVNARPACLIPVLLDSSALPPGPWTTQAIPFAGDVNQVAMGVVQALRQSQLEHPELSRAVAPATMPAPAPVSRPTPKHEEYHFVSNAGNAVVTFSGIIAVLSFFALPYINLGILGSYTGAQVANLVGSAYSVATSTPSYYSATTTATQSGLNPALLVWAEVLLAGFAAGLAAWQWYRSNDSGDPPSRPAVVLVFIASILSVLILLYQVVGLQSSALGQAIASVLGFGYWLMLLAMIAAVLGGVAQLRAFSAS